MSMKVNRDTNFLAQGLEQLGGCGRSAKASHVLNGKNMGPHFFEFSRLVDIVVQRILFPLRVIDVSRIADSRFAN